MSTFSQVCLVCFLLASNVSDKLLDHSSTTIVMLSIASSSMIEWLSLTTVVHFMLEMMQLCATVLPLEACTVTKNSGCQKLDVGKTRCTCTKYWSGATAVGGLGRNFGGCSHKHIFYFDCLEREDFAQMHN